MRQTMQCRAATNHFWVSMTNSSGRYAPYPSCFIQPDGRIVRQLRMNRPGMMVCKVDLGKKLEECSIADLRRVFRHQQRNIDMLYSPFPPIRLFQKIDIGYIEHLYQPRVKTHGHI